MGKEKNEKINVNEYIQAHVPDKTRLATLLSEAKGSDRTMAEFAAACGVSASTFSRILNYKMTRPLDRDLIVLIAENADKRCFDALERLLQANGMISPERHRLSNFPFTFHFHALEKERQPTPVFLPGESQGQGSLVGCHLWGHTESDMTGVT